MKVYLLFIVTIVSGFSYAQGSGDLDTNFGNGNSGKIIIEHNLGSIVPLNEGEEYGNAIHVYPNGSMLIGGYAYYTNSLNIDMVVTKLLHSGVIDVNWGVNGHAVVGFDRGGSMQDRLFDIEVDPSGNILLIGSAEFLGDDTDFAIAKLKSNGNLDTDFSSDGKMTVHFDDGGDNGDVAYSAYTFNQAIFVVGYATQSTGKDFAMTKILNDELNAGDVDTNFGVNGRKLFDFAHSTNSIDSARRIYAKRLKEKYTSAIGDAALSAEWEM